MNDIRVHEQAVEEAKAAAARLMQGIYNEPHYAVTFAAELARIALKNNTKKHLRAVLEISARIVDTNVMFGPHQEA